MTKITTQTPGISDHEDIIYRVRLRINPYGFLNRHVPRWYHPYTKSGGYRGCYDSVTAAKKSAAIHGYEEFEIWRFHVGAPNETPVPYFMPEMVFEKMNP